VAVHDYICKSHDTESKVSSCDPHHQDESFESAVGPRRVTSHISVHTVYPNGFQELYRHFLRLPDGAIIEVRITEIPGGKCSVCYSSLILYIYIYACYNSFIRS
jgi:hypothetical protein